MLTLAGSLMACQPDVALDTVPRSAVTAMHPVQVWLPPGTGTVATALKDHKGKPITVTCSTCHAGPVAPDTSGRGQAEALHAKIKLAHGDLPCFACHDRADRDRLHLADGSTLPFTAVVTLCSQCHAMQARDFAHGAHGGMNGYWDLTRGPRTRHACIVCHDAHAPRYPRLLPAPASRDRFLTPKSAHSEGSHP